MDGLGLSAGEAGAWFLGAALVVVLALLLRPRPPRVVVSSHLLWDQVLPKRRNPWLWDLLLLALQLLVLGAGALALRDPRDPSAPPLSVEGGGAPRDRIFVLDTSRSMGARDGERTRLQLAAEEVARSIDELPASVRFLVVEAGPEPTLLCPLGTDRALAHLALRRLQPGDRGSDLFAAVAFAVNRPELRRDQATLELWTDDPAAGRLAEPGAGPAQSPDGSERPPAVPVRIRAPFQPANNVAITTFDIRAARGIPAEEEALLLLRNEADLPARVALRLETPEAVLGRAEVEIAPRGTLRRSYRFASLDARWIEARIEGASWDPAPGGTLAPDALPGDDRAFALAEPVRPARVGLAGATNRFLTQGLSLLPGVELVQLDSSAWDAPLADDLDAVFLDGVLPPGPLPPRAVLIRPPAGGPVALGEPRIEPKLTDWNREHPLFRGLVLGDLLIRQARLLEPAPGDERLLGTADGPIALARVDADGRRLVVWGLDFADTDLPLRIAFPQVLLQTVLWMRDARSGAEEPVHPWPAEATLRLGDGVTSVRDATLGGDESAGPGALDPATPPLDPAATLLEGDALRWLPPAPALLRMSGGATPADPTASSLLPVAPPEDLESDLTVLPAASPDAVPLPAAVEEQESPRRWLAVLLALAVLVGALEFFLWTR